MYTKGVVKNFRFLQLHKKKLFTFWFTSGIYPVIIKEIRIYTSISIPANPLLTNWS